MPDSLPDLNATCQVYERKLRALKRSILGIVDSGKQALEDESAAYSFRARLASAQSDWEQYQKVWDDRDSLQVHADDPDSWPTQDWLSDYDRLKEELCSAAAIAMRMDDRSTKPILPKTEGQSLISNSSGTPMGHSAVSHLPAINIPSFSGDPLQWIQFKDTFESVVHKEGSLPNVKRFHYLRGALSGEAANLISHIPVGDASYEQAWAKLTKAYDNPRVLANLYVQRIIDCDARSQKTERQRYEAFLNGVADGIEGFRSLDLPEKTDFLLSALALRALDSHTRSQLELSLRSTNTAPTADEVVEFVRKRLNASRFSQDSHNIQPSNFRQSTSVTYQKGFFPQGRAKKYNPVALHSTTGSKPRSFRLQNKKNSSKERPIPCAFCAEGHGLGRCPKFSALPVDRRVSFVNGWRGCRNCLTEGHKVSDCTSKWNCRTCHKRHHTLVHMQAPLTNVPNDPPAGPATADVFTGFGSAPRHAAPLPSVVLLGTFTCFLKDKDGYLHSARGVLDSGSQQTFLSSAMAAKLNLPLQRYDGHVTGLGGATVTKPIGLVSCIIKPQTGLEEIPTQAAVVDHISSQLPSVRIPESILNKLHHLDLADRSFNTPGVVDLLVGADIFSVIVNGPPKRSPVTNLSLMPTVFGLAVIGKLGRSDRGHVASFYLQSSETVEEQLKLFWELEEPSPIDRTNPDDRLCENHFLETHSRTEEGRYILHLPFKSQALPLGNNREQVVKRFVNLEQRFVGNPSLLQKYTEFMKEYRDLGHMTVAKEPSNYLIPHHGVWQGSKLRVVFDASCRSTSGNSLNDALLPGPKLQKDICVVLTRFRMYAIPLCADIVKMYRQILIAPKDRQVQHILWRDNPEDELVEWELNTVTYGVRSSSYQALRVVNQLIIDEGRHFPLAADRASRDMFVDDIVTGANSLQEAAILKEQLCCLFAKGGFSLSKWASTELSLIPNEQRSVEQFRIKAEDELSGGAIKILGLIWTPGSDSFSYTIRTPDHPTLTKRLVLSSVARIYDPLGFLSPVIFIAKILLQETWKASLTWDEPLPSFLVQSWNSIFDEWAVLSTISIPRYIASVNACHTLVGFCDASTKGYAAAAYLVSQVSDGSATASLIKAKTKVAPLKFTSVARLELCAAVLLSRLISSLVVDGITVNKLRCFTDSMTVLSWLRLPTHTLKVFEANRVDQILNVVPLEAWGHVRSDENPCDLASRGCTPSTIKQSLIWWRGPRWLVQPSESWPSTALCGPAPNVFLVNELAQPKEQTDDWTKRFSSLNMLIRTVCRILRFREVVKPSRKSISRPLTAADVRDATTRLIKLVQRGHLPAGMFAGKTTPTCFQQLLPFIDEHGIIRVGGRLQNASLDPSAKHPVLMPSNANFSTLLIRDTHEKAFHAGPSLVLALLRQNYWIPKARKSIKRIIHSCVYCRKVKAKPLSPIMSPLPKDRFIQTRPFVTVGVDFAGPFSIRESSRRNASLGKAYLCVYVCLATKALHLEAVTALSTAAFLTCFERFTSRRGLPSTVWSDNGTNFVGASRFIKDVYAFLASEEESLTEKLALKGVEWKFIPPRAPHFGGIWEAGVKSVKGLLTSTIGSQPYTFEELTTVFCRIEGLLNSRPLCALTDDVQDFSFITPGHFIIGAPISSLPEPSDDLQSSNSIVHRWDVMRSQIANIWERWRKEYLHSLQQRRKWFRRTPNLEVGDLVVLIERRTLLGQWPVARVVETHPGKDGVVRTVVVKTPSGSCFTRATSSLVPLFASSPTIVSDPVQATP